MVISDVSECKTKRDGVHIYFAEQLLVTKLLNTVTFLCAKGTLGFLYPELDKVPRSVRMWRREFGCRDRPELGRSMYVT